MEFKMLFRTKRREASEKAEQKEEVQLHISSTGRVWVNPKEVVRSEAFQRQREAVKRLREAQEKAAAA